MEYTREEIYYIWLASIDGVGPVTFASLVAAFGSAEGVFSDAPKRPELLDGIPRFGKRMAQVLADSCNEGAIEKFFANMEKKGIAAVSRLSPAYPKRLLEVFAPPLVLYCKGRTELLGRDKAIAVIGTREPTPYGRTVAGKVAKALAENGVCVVSGMAKGIDICAHLGALEGKGETVAVLGNGADIAYPADKSYVYEQICREGLVISEYVPGTTPAPGNFPARNRIISGLAIGVVVVEAGEKSGTNITVNYALEQGKDVFAVPGSITSGASFSTNQLIKSGCEVVTSEEDVLEYYGWGGRQKRKGASAKVKSAPPMQLTFQERMLTDALEAGEKSFDELYELSQFSMPELFTLMAELELKGIVGQKPGRVYFLAGGTA